MKLESRIVEKVWGRRDLPAPYSRKCARPVGEIWFEPAAPLEELLIKYLFTGEKLSVQVHPAERDGRPGRGKDECWLVLDAEPDARVAIGFRAPMTGEAVRRAALDGSIEDRLQWHPAKRGDFFYLPAGTVHAIGPGLTLVEVQQNTDITYRLYDYGRPRDLHLDDALRVLRGVPHPGELRRENVGETSLALVNGPHFRLDCCVGSPGAEMSARHRGAVMVLPLAGTIGAEGEDVGPGECAIFSTLAALRFSPEARCLLASVARTDQSFSPNVASIARNSSLP